MTSRPGAPPLSGPPGPLFPGTAAERGSRSPGRSRVGLTFVEVLVTMALLGTLIGVIAPNIRVGKLTQSGSEKLEAIQRVRVAQKRLRRLVETGTAVLYPPVGETAGCAVVTDRVNLPHVLFLDPEGQLQMLPSGGEAEVLARGVESFEATQPFDAMLELKMVTEAGKGVPLTILVTAYAGNQFHGTGGWEP